MSQPSITGTVQILYDALPAFVIKDGKIIRRIRIFPGPHCTICYPGGYRYGY